MSLDGVMQAPGGPHEDPTGGFVHGGWVAPLWDDALSAAVGETFSKPYDLLLGRRTYDIFAAYWRYIERNPAHPTFDAGNARIAEQFDRVTKYVATHHPEGLTWQNTKALGADVVSALRALKQEQGPMLLVQGSSELLQLLLASELVDELRLLVFPVLLGKGKRVFGSSVAAGTWKLTSSTTSPNGVLITSYEPAGAIRTGSFETQPPSAAELLRRRKWA